MDKYLKEYASEGAKKTQRCWTWARIFSCTFPIGGFQITMFGSQRVYVVFCCWIGSTRSYVMIFLHETFGRSVKRRAGKPTDQSVSLVYCNDLHTSEISTARYISGWWFGTFFIFHVIYGMSSFPLTSIFGRGRSTTNQWLLSQLSIIIPLLSILNHINPY